jgi:hypothetical protein
MERGQRNACAVRSTAALPDEHQVLSYPAFIQDPEILLGNSEFSREANEEVC